MKRVGKKFNFGVPYLTDRNIIYSWHDSDVDYKKAFMTAKQELGSLLLEKTKKYAKKMSIRLDIGHPYLQDAPEHIGLHIGMNDAGVQIGIFMGNSVASFKNIDHYDEMIMGFNLVSDVLEFLDKEVRAPRIILEDGNYVIRYFLPEGIDLLPVDTYPNFFTIEHLQKIFADDMGKIEKIVLNSSMQELISNYGIIHIEKGVCEGRGFKGRDITKATYPVAKLLESCNKW